MSKEKASDENENENEDKEEKKRSFLVKHREAAYDIAGFLRYHPGGGKAVEHYRGLDLDAVMRRTAHSEAAYHLLQDFIVDNRRDYDDIEVNNNNNIFQLFLHLLDILGTTRAINYVTTRGGVT